jgi:hypothetical protein
MAWIAQLGDGRWVAVVVTGDRRLIRWADPVRGRVEQWAADQEAEIRDRQASIVQDQKTRS